MFEVKEGVPSSKEPLGIWVKKVAFLEMEKGSKHKLKEHQKRTLYPLHYAPPGV